MSIIQQFCKHGIPTHQFCPICSDEQRHRQELITQTQIEVEKMKNKIVKKMVEANGAFGTGQDDNAVSHPKHYNRGKIEVIEFIEDQGLGYHLGNAIKYICRAGVKDSSKYVEDLEKAIWYVRRQIELKNDSPRRPNDMRPRT